MKVAASAANEMDRSIVATRRGSCGNCPWVETHGYSQLPLHGRFVELRQRLLARNYWKVIQEFFECVFPGEIIEQALGGHTRTGKYNRSAHDVRRRGNNAGLVSRVHSRIITENINGPGRVSAGCCCLFGLRRAPAALRKPCFGLREGLAPLRERLVVLRVGLLLLRKPFYSLRQALARLREEVAGLREALAALRLRLAPLRLRFQSFLFDLNLVNNHSSTASWSEIVARRI